MFMKLIVLSALVLLLPVRASCSPSETVDIGAFLCLTGNCSDWGTAALQGAQLAVREINAQGGVLGKQLKLHVEDTKESISGAQAVTAFKKLTEIEKIRFLIGPSWSPGGLAVAPLARRSQNLILITPSVSAEEFSRAGPNLFNIRPVERNVTETFARYLHDHGFHRAAVLASTQPAESSQGAFFRDAFTKAGGTVVKQIETNPELLDVRTEAVQIVASKPDIIFLIAYNQLLNAASSLRALNYSGAIATISIDDARVAAAGGLLEGLLVARALPPSKTFSENYSAEYKTLPGLSAENGYDAIYALKYAIDAAGSLDPKSVAQKMAGIRFSGAAGDIAFNDSRGVEQPPGLYKVKFGKLERLQSETAGEQTPASERDPSKG